MAEFKHLTVLLQEAVDALVGDVDGFYVDGTFARRTLTFVVVGAGKDAQLLGLIRIQRPSRWPTLWRRRMDDLPLPMIPLRPCNRGLRRWVRRVRSRYFG